MFLLLIVHTFLQGLAKKTVVRILEVIEPCKSSNAFIILFKDFEGAQIHLLTDFEVNDL